MSFMMFLCHCVRGLVVLCFVCDQLFVITFICLCLKLECKYLEALAL